MIAGKLVYLVVELIFLHKNDVVQNWWKISKEAARIKFPKKRRLKKSNWWYRHIIYIVSLSLFEVVLVKCRQIKGYSSDSYTTFLMRAGAPILFVWIFWINTSKTSNNIVFFTMIVWCQTAVFISNVRDRQISHTDFYEALRCLKLFFQNICRNSLEISSPYRSSKLKTTKTSCFSNMHRFFIWHVVSQCVELNNSL